MPKKPQYPIGLGLVPKLPSLKGLISGTQEIPKPNDISKLVEMQVVNRKDIPWDKCPQKYLGQVKDYFENGFLPTMHVVNWALRNNLVFAISTCKAADFDELILLCQFLFDHCPQDAWGSESNVLAWVQYNDNVRKGDLSSYSIFKKASRDMEIIRSKAVHDCTLLLQHVTEFIMKGKDPNDMGILPILKRKAELCLAGEYAASLSIKLFPQK